MTTIPTDKMVSALNIFQVQALEPCEQGLHSAAHLLGDGFMRGQPATVADALAAGVPYSRVFWVVYRMAWLGRNAAFNQRLSMWALDCAAYYQREDRKKAFWDALAEARAGDTTATPQQAGDGWEVIRYFGKSARQALRAADTARLAYSGATAFAYNRLALWTGETEPEPWMPEWWSEDYDWTTMWCVAIYLVDKRYGGPEEGGWYYNCGVPLDYALPDVPQQAAVPRYWPAEKYQEALRWQDYVQQTLDETVNKGRRPISSVLSEGVYQARLERGHPAPFPKERPHYE
jgi:hypothetical protein